MGIYVNPNAVLLLMALNSPIFVDKSMAIVEVNKLVNSNNRFVCLSRARRFGKTMLGNMLSAYFTKGCNSKPLFNNLKIAKDPSYEKYLNKLNVIKLDVNSFYSNYGPDADIVPIFTGRIRKELKQQFPDVDLVDDDTLDSCLWKIYSATGEQFVIILDEYDVLIREKVSQPIFASYLRFLNGMFKNADLAPAIALAYLTGILPIVRDKVQSKLNLFREYSMFSPGPFADCIGFTNDEVQALCKEYVLDFDDCKRWYDGYNLNGIEVYNSNSVVYAMENRKFANYWNQTGSFAILTDFLQLNFKGILDDVKFMLGGGHVDVNIETFLNTLTDFHTKNDVFTYLIHLGYLAYDEDEKQCYIPNKEIYNEWVNAIERLDTMSTVFDLIQNSKRLLQATIDGDSEAVAAALDAAHMQICNNLSYNDEHTFQSVINLAYLYAREKYTILKEMPTGKGVADVVFIPYVPNVPALIVELKRNKSEKTALDQIRNKNYGAALEKYSGDLLFVGVNYDDETKVHTCKIVKFSKE